MKSPDETMGEASAEKQTQNQVVEKWKNKARESGVISDISMEHIASIDDLRMIALQRVATLKNQVENSKLFTMFNGERERWGELPEQAQRLEDFRFKITSGYTREEFFRELAAVDAALDLLGGVSEDHADVAGEYIVAALSTIREVSWKMGTLSEKIGQPGNQGVIGGEENNLDLKR